LQRSVGSDAENEICNVGASFVDLKAVRELWKVIGVDRVPYHSLVDVVNLSIGQHGKDGGGEEELSLHFEIY